MRRIPQPEWVEPMLARLTHGHFSREGWIFEPKLDGERCLVFRRGRSLRLLSRNRVSLNEAYPELERPLLAAGETDFLAGGEVVAFDGGRTSFERLQRRMQIRDPGEALRHGVPVFYYLFDLLFLDGADLRQQPLASRKRLLRDHLSFAEPLRFLEHRETEGEAYYEEACRRGWEGLIAKRAASAYVAGRSRDWLKFKCAGEQELVIGGYTEPRGTRAGFGALLVGYHESGRLRYAGKVGAGFSDEILRSLSRQLREIERTSAPFADGGRSQRGVHWVEPKLVAQVAFTEWTRDGKLRHPRFLGLRRDKPAGEVVRE